MPVVNYLWNPINHNIIREFDDLGNTIAAYTTEPGLHGNLISQRRNGQDSVYHYDGQGSTLALTNSNGDVTDSYAYNAFGEVTSRTGDTINPFQYIGQKGYYSNNSGQLEVRRRPLSTSMGIWLSVDPLDVLRVMNPYQYVSQRPTFLIDASGMIAVPAKDPPCPIKYKGCTGEITTSKLHLMSEDRFVDKLKDARRLLLGIGISLVPDCCKDDCPSLDFIQGIFLTRKGDKAPFTWMLDVGAYSPIFYGGTQFRGSDLHNVPDLDGTIAKLDPMGKYDAVCSRYPIADRRKLFATCASMFDRPHIAVGDKFPKQPAQGGDTEMRFETCAVCRESDDSFSVLGCVTWGANFIYDGSIFSDQTMTSVFGPNCTGDMSGFLKKALP